MNSDQVFLDDYLNDELFIVCGDEDQEGGTEMYLFSEIANVQAHLLTMTPSIDSDTRLIHGILTRAEFLPKRMRGKTAFLIIENANDPEKGVVTETAACSVEDLAKDIQSVLARGQEFIAFNGIDALFILYGYELELSLTVDPYTLDEEVIDDCIAISVEVKEIQGELTGSATSYNKTIFQGGMQ